jgi:moderate conductance mechanosensitive channel
MIDMRVVLLVCMLFGLIGDVSAEEVPPQLGRVEQLLRLLEDPEVRTWLATQPSARSETVTSLADSADIVRWENETRRRIDGVIDAMPRIPFEVAAAAAPTWADAVGHKYAPAFVVFTFLLMIGTLAESLFRRAILKRTIVSTKLRSLESAALSDSVPILVFAAAMAMVFFGFAWPL